MIVRALAVLVFALFSVVAFGGCQAIVSDEVPAFTCQGTSLAACPRGMYCKGAGCVPCANEDTCDGLDNDCNGTIDDGAASDHDGDGATFCGRAGDEGKLVDVDCNDDDPEIFPGAEETCNGIDDDCDGVADNADKVCKVGEVCAPRGGGCIPETQACTITTCTPPKICDEGTRQCVNPTANLPLGAACGSDQECESGVCATPSMLGGVISGPKGVCSKPCCTSQQCSLGFVCYAPGTGGRYCVGSEVAGRTKSPGAGAAGAACTKNEDCRSGQCTNNKCLDTCCSDSDCKTPTKCGFVDRANKSFFGCIMPPGPGTRHDACVDATECTSNLCAFYVDAQHCVAPCCSSTADCGIVGGKPVLCVNAKSTLTKNAIIAACISTTPVNGTKSFGDTCTGNDECKSGLCDGVTARCSSVCCLDSDCPRSTPCRPAPSGVLRCVP